MLPSGNTMLAEFCNKEGKILNTNQVYLVEKNRNAIFKYYGNKYDRFKYNSSASNMVWAVTQDNKLAVYSYEDFAGIPSNSSKFVFKMNVVEYNFKSLGELKSFLNI